MLYNSTYCATSIRYIRQEASAKDKPGRKCTDMADMPQAWQTCHRHGRHATDIADMPQTSQICRRQVQVYTQDQTRIF